MKHRLCIILAIGVILSSFSACSSHDRSDVEQQETTMEHPTSSESWMHGSLEDFPAEENTQSPENDTYLNGTPYKKFGSAYEFTSEYNGKKIKYVLNIPDCDTPMTKKLFFTRSKNGDQILIDQMEVLEETNILPSLEKDFLENLNAIFGTSHEAELELKKSSLFEFSDRGFQKAIYQLKQNPGDRMHYTTLIAYATQLSNGAYIYWTVYGGRQYVESCRTAENMVYTLQEIEDYG